MGGEADHLHSSGKAALACTRRVPLTSPPIVVQVRKAKGEMRRLLEEETLRFGLQAAADKSAYGKFTVV